MHAGDVHELVREQVERPPARGVQPAASHAHPRERRIVTGDSFYTQHPAVAHFGLGQGEAAGMVVVHWPDGRVETLEGNDERDLPAGAVFEMRTPGGGGWGPA